MTMYLFQIVGQRIDKWKQPSFEHVSLMATLLFPGVKVRIKTYFVDAGAVKILHSNNL